MSRQTKRLFSFSKHDNAVLGYLITPSWLSGLVVMVVSSAVVLWVVLSAINYDGSSLSGSLRQLFNLHNTQSSSLNGTYQTLGNNFAANSILSDIPLFIFWSGVGLVVYSFTANLVKSLRNAASLTAELNYVNADRHELIATALEHLLIRALVLAAWFFLLRYTLHTLVPYVIALAHAGTLLANKLQATGYIGGGILLLAVFLHLQVIMLRLVLLKPRVFWQSTYN